MANRLHMWIANWMSFNLVYREQITYVDSKLDVLQPGYICQIYREPILCGLSMTLELTHFYLSPMLKIGKLWFCLTLEISIKITNFHHQNNKSTQWLPIWKKWVMACLNKTSGVSFSNEGKTTKQQKEDSIQYTLPMSLPVSLLRDQQLPAFN